MAGPDYAALAAAARQKFGETEPDYGALAAAAEARARAEGTARPPGLATLGEQLAAKEAARAAEARRQGTEAWGAYLAQTIRNIPKDAIDQAGGLVHLLATAAGATAELGDDIGNTARDAVGLTPYYLKERPNQDALKALPGAVVKHYANYLDPDQRALQVREHPVGVVVDLSPAAALRRGAPPVVPTGPSLAARAGAATAGARTAASTAAATARSVAATPAGSTAVALGRTALDWSGVGPAIRTAETVAAQIQRWHGVYRAWQEAAAQAKASGAPVPPPPAPPAGVGAAAPAAPAAPAAVPVPIAPPPPVAAAPAPIAAAPPMQTVAELTGARPPAPIAPPVTPPAPAAAGPGPPPRAVDVAPAPAPVTPVPAPAAPPVAARGTAPGAALPEGATIHRPWEGRPPGQQSPAWLANDLGLAARRAGVRFADEQVAQAAAHVQAGGLTPAQAVDAVRSGVPAPAVPATPAPGAARASVPPPASGGQAAAVVDTLQTPWAARTRGQQSPAWLANDIGVAARRARLELTPAQRAAAGELVTTGGRTPAEAVRAVAPAKPRLTLDEAREVARLRAAGRTAAEIEAALTAQRTLAAMTPSQMRAEIAARTRNLSPARN